MRWNRHFELAGRHSFLSPSKYHWVNYTPEKFRDVYAKSMAARLGDRWHAFACEAIKLKARMPRTKATINQYVNDAIGFKMDPEVLLFYSLNSFGTADAIAFRKNILRISDLKTGSSPTSMSQLKVYVALFCLEYDIKPGTIELIELRIYQNDEVKLEIPTVDEILHIMDRIVTYDKAITEMETEASL